MRYEIVKKLACDDFRRMTGVKPKTFGNSPGSGNFLTIMKRAFKSEVHNQDWL